MAWVGFVQGIGCSVFWVPLSVVTFATLAPSRLPEGAAIFHLLRNFGSSIFIAVSVMIVIRSSKVNYAEMAELVHPFNENWQIMSGGTWNISSLNGLVSISGEINRQAQIIGYSNAILIYTAACFASLPLLLLVRTSK